MLGLRCKYITVALVLVSVTASSVSENYLMLRLTFLVFDNVCCGCFIANYWKAKKHRISGDNWRLVHLLPFLKLRPESVDGLMVFESCSTMFVSLSHQYLMFILFIRSNPFVSTFCVCCEGVWQCNRCKQWQNDNLFFLGGAVLKNYISINKVLSWSWKQIEH